MLSAKRHVIVVLCFLAAIIDGFDLQVVSIAGPQVQSAMHLGPEQMGWIFSASLIGLMFGALVGGYYADHYGRKPVLVSSVAALGVVTVLTPLASNYPELMTARILAGLTIGGVMPNIVTVVADISKPGRVTSVVAMMICGQPLGGIFVSLAGHPLADRFGWQSLFLLGGVLPLVLGPAMFFWLAETKPTGSEAHTKPSQFSALLGPGNLVPTLLLWVVFILSLGILSVLLGWTPTLAAGAGLPVPLGYAALLWINVGGIAGSFAIGWLCDRIGVRTTMSGAFLLMAGSLWLFSQGLNVHSILPLAALTGFMVLGAQFALFGLAPLLYAPASRGAGVGAALALGRVGAIFGPIIAGDLLAAGLSESGVFAVMAPVAVVAGAALLALTYVSGNAFAKNTSLLSSEGNSTMA